MGWWQHLPIRMQPPQPMDWDRNPFSHSVLFCCHRWVRAWRVPGAELPLHTNLALNPAKSSSCSPVLLIWQAGRSYNLLNAYSSPLIKPWCMWSPQIQWEYCSHWEILVSRILSFPVLVHSQYVRILPLNSTGVEGGTPGSGEFCNNMGENMHLTTPPVV